MIENIFEKKFAECLIARTVNNHNEQGEAVGLALVCSGLPASLINRVTSCE